MIRLLDTPGQKATPSKRLGTRLWRGVTLQLFLVAVLPLTLLVLVVSFGSLRLHHQAMRTLVADRNLRAVQSAAASISKEISHRGETLKLLAMQLEGRTQPGEALAKLEGDLAIFEGGVTAVKHGQVVAFVGDTAVQELTASPGMPQIQTVVQTGSTAGPVYLPPQNIQGGVFVPVVVPGPDDIFLVGLFSPEILLNEGLTILSDEELVTVLVIDPDYRVLYRSGQLSPEEDLSTHPGIQNALAGTSGIDYLPTAEGEHVITTSTVQPVGWALMIEESWEDIASPLLRLTQNAPLIIIPILGIALLALWFGLRQIVQPLQALEEKAGDLATGNFETIRQPVGGVPEIGHLQETMIEMADQLKQAQTSLHNYIGAITDSVESERRNLARELHDDTLQSLIALGQYTQYALHWNKDPKVAKTLDQVVSLVEQGLKNLRGLVQGLRPIYIEDLGLATALAMQADHQQRPDGIDVHFQQEGDERRLKSEVEMALYRIAQEALNNIQRHSEAKNAWISLFFRNDGLVLEIRDDGKGFPVPPDPNHFARQGHYGLLGLYERAELIGARLSIHSAPAEGTLIRVRLAAAESQPQGTDA